LLTLQAGIPRKLAPTIGISVDPRRANLSEEGLAANVERLKAYKERLILFPRRTGKAKKGDASASDVKAAKAGETNVTRHASSLLPIENKKEVTEGNIKDFESEENAYKKLREARSAARFVGVRAKRAKVQEEEASAAKK